MLAGLGAICTQLPSLIIIQLYFEKRRAFAAGISGVGMGIGVLTTPLIYSLLIDHFGWRGTMLLHAGLALQGVVLGACYRPLRPLPSAQKDMRQGGDSESKKGRIMSKLCDTRLLKQKTFALFLIANFGQMFGHFGGMTMVPIRAVSLGMTKMQGALLMLVAGLCSTAARFINSFLANLKCTNRVLEMAVAGTIGGVLICVVNLCDGFALNAVVIGFFGATLGMA